MRSPIRLRQKGSALALATVLGLALVLLGLGYVAFIMYMGGQNQTKNAVEAGGLNVGKQVLDNITVRVPALGGARSKFYDVTYDSENNNLDGRINLRRINRVWAKAMLIAMNSEGMSRQGYGGSHRSNAGRAYRAAQSISNELSNQLKNQRNLYPFFNRYARGNSVRMLGAGASVRVNQGDGWETSLMNRNAESNVEFTSALNPPGFFLSRANTTTTTRASRQARQAAGGMLFLRGYRPIRVGARTFWQVPFVFDEKPRNVSRNLFGAAKPSSSPIAWANAVPNSFSVDGVANQGNKVGQRARAWVLSNPRETFKASIPRSFVHIKLDRMRIHWYYMRGPWIRHPSLGSYGFIPTFRSGPLFPMFGMNLSVSVMAPPLLFGSEVAGADLYGAIIGRSPKGNTRRVEDFLVNRMNQMVTRVGRRPYTRRDLRRVLGTGRGSLAAGIRDFYMYSPNGRDVVVQPSLQARARATWIGGRADGTERRLTSARSFNPVGLFGMPPTVVPVPPLNRPSVSLSRVFSFTWHKELHWTPGSGYSGNLGRLRVRRWSEVRTIGVSVPIPSPIP